MKEELLNKVIQTITKNTDLKAEDLGVDSNFEDIGMDSLDQMTVIADLEKEYKIVLPNEEVLKIKTIGQAVDSLHRILATSN